MCTRCVMDEIGDNTIRYEADGTCNYCNYALSRMDTVYFPNEEGARRLEAMIRMLKEQGRKKEYDCLMGISGGLDSAYLAYLGAARWGLRILAVHIDDGFDTDVARLNIENLRKNLHLKLVIEQPDKAQYADLLKSFIRAGVPAIAIPQDNVLQAYLKIYAQKYKLKYYLSGANFALESIIQRGNGYVAADGTHIRAIHKKYGEAPLTDLPLITLFDRYIGQKFISRIETLRPLDLIDYNREKAIRELRENVGFNYYGGKHYESVFTKFMQVYYLPHKFGIDKRKWHYSSLIVSGQMTRDEALEALKKPLYDETQMEKDITFILGQIGMGRDEFDRLMQEPGRSHDEFRKSAFTRVGGTARKFRKVLGE